MENDKWKIMENDKWKIGPAVAIPIHRNPPYDFPFVIEEHHYFPFVISHLSFVIEEPLLPPAASRLQRSGQNSAEFVVLPNDVTEQLVLEQ